MVEIDIPEDHSTPPAADRRPEVVNLIRAGVDSWTFPKDAISANFDIETEPLDDDDLIRIVRPFDPASIGPHPGVFDPARVKLGNMKDKAKIEAKIIAAEVAHAAEIESWTVRQESAEIEYWAKVRSDSTLSPTRSRCCVIGVRHNVDPAVVNILHGDEALVLESFWDLYRICVDNSFPMFGFNIMFFDLPYLVRRSWLLGVQVPSSVRDGRYWSQTFVDIARDWAMGDTNSRIALDELSRAFGLGGKRDQEVDGKTFWRDWHDPNRRELAVGYLATDLWLNEAVAVRMGRTV